MTDPDKLSRKQFLSSLGKGALGLAAVGLAGGCGPPAPTAQSALPAVPPEPEPEPLPYRLELAATLNPGLTRLKGVAADAEGRILAAGAQGIKVLDPQGVPLRDIPTSGAICAVATDPAGHIYAAQRTRIEKFGPDGESLLAWGTRGIEPGQFLFITSLTASERFVYVADSGARKIHRYAADGDYIDEIAGYSIPVNNPCCVAPEDFGRVAEIEKGFVIPSGYFDLALNAAGHLIVGHTGRHRVERYDGNGKLVDGWGSYGARREHFCGCCNPTNLALFADGRVATTEKGVPRLKVHSAEGTLLAFLGPEAFPGNAAGMALATDPQGRILLAEPISGTIRIYEVKAI